MSESYTGRICPRAPLTVHHLWVQSVCLLLAFLPLQPLRVNSQPGPQKRCLFVCRHGERMDVVFGKYWLSQCFDAKGE